jgi:hypothetical protein
MVLQSGKIQKIPGPAVWSAGPGQGNYILKRTPTVK